MTQRRRSRPPSGGREERAEGVPAGGRTASGKKSPSEAYAASRERQREAPIDVFEADLGFPLDPYQREACAGLLAGESVLVAAPTGAGKTVVALFGIDRARGQGRRV
ncbi:MAG: DEAD/DEAH box helicase, partial [Bifidobacteriaceae bacterium]|nr:DEAD/DEAH box helicase [Bifidobacteriaceae bacterium]